MFALKNVWKDTIETCFGIIRDVIFLLEDSCVILSGKRVEMLDPTADFDQIVILGIIFFIIIEEKYNKIIFENAFIP